MGLYKEKTDLSLAFRTRNLENQKICGTFPSKVSAV